MSATIEMTPAQRVAEIRAEQTQLLDYADAVGENTREGREALARFDALQEERDQLNREAAARGAQLPCYVSYHEAGHALAFWKSGARDITASIVPSATSEGRVMSDTPLDTYARAVMLLAGPAAGAWSPEQPDNEFFACGDDLAKVGSGLGAQYPHLVAQARKEAAQLVHENLNPIRALACALFERKTLDAADIAAVMREWNVR